MDQFNLENLLGNGLPRFKGLLKEHEKGKVDPGPDVRHFLRTIDLYLLQNNITQNAQKVRLLLNQIHKSEGTAANFLQCYAGRQYTYDRIKEDLINLFPSFDRTLFKVGARGVLDIRLQQSELGLTMSQLESASRAAVEAYLEKPVLARFGIHQDNIVNDLNGPPQNQDGQQQEEGNEDEEGAHAAQPPQLNIGPEVTLQELLQNFLLHLITASQLSDGVYKQIENLGPERPSTEFMSLAVRAAEKDKLTNKDANPRGRYRAPEVLYNIRNQQEGRNPHQKCDGQRWEPTK